MKTGILAASAALCMSVQACSREVPPPQSSSATSAVAPAVAPAAPADTRPVVLVLGTSLAAGLGLDNPADAYPGVLQRIADSAGFGVHVVNAGVSGETSAGARRRVERFLSPAPAIVIVETGANDGLRALDADSTAANLRAIVDTIRARAPSAKVVIAQMEAPTNLGPAYTKRFHDLYPAAAKATGVTLMPFLLDGVAGTPRLNQEDGIHPTKEGAAIVGRNVWKTLAPMLKKGGAG